MIPQAVAKRVIPKLYSYGLYSYGLYSCGLHSYGLWQAVAKRVIPKDVYDQWHETFHAATIATKDRANLVLNAMIEIEQVPIV